MVRRRRMYALGAAALIVLAGGSYAVAGALDGPGNVPEAKRFHAELNGFQEVASISTTGFGEFDARLVEPERIHYVLQYADLEGGATLFSHIHFGQRSVNGGVSVFLCGGGGKRPCAPVADRIEGDITPADVVGPSTQGIEALSWAELLRAMRAGHTYVNVHTTRWGTGEIRGQVNDRDQKEFDR